METEKRFLSIRETAAELSCSEPTIHRRIKDKSLPSLKFGGRILISREAIDRLAARALEGAA